MTLGEFIKEIEKDKKQKEILAFFEERWLGEVLGLDDIYDENENIDALISEGALTLRDFLRVLEAEKGLIGTKDFLTDKPGYPAPNHAGFEYPEPDEIVR